MKTGTVKISPEEIEKQYAFMAEYKAMNDAYAAENGRVRTARVRNFGCQMNEHDSEKIAGMLTEMGYNIVGEEVKNPDLIIFNTCCVRENAEEKVYGHLGALKGLKRENPEMLICVCGCMTEQPQVVEEIKKKYKNVDLVFGTQNLHTFPELLLGCVKKQTHTYDTHHTDGLVAENVPVRREDKIKAWVTVMYGCNNFCSYCIVPYVRGRERSRAHEDILQEIKKLEKDGIQEITLLGQNVNSYGKDCDEEISFAALLQLICDETDIPRIRFMTPHPKDLSDELIDVMARNPQICRQLHLPVQSGSTSLLKKMNRHYTREQYLDLVDRIRAKIPDIALSTDVIVGFPGETDEDFEDTYTLFEKVRYDMAYTFIYSKRTGTPAATWEQVPEDVVKARFDRLLDLQNRIDREINDTYEGKTVEVLVEGPSKNNPDKFCGRTSGNKVVNFTCDEKYAGKIIKVKITEAATWNLNGEALKE